MDDARPALDDVLTPREREVIEFLRLGFTNEQIGGRMGISANAVKYHVSEIISKLGVRNRREAARWPERRPWWATAFAPAALLLRRSEAALPVKLSTAALAISGGVVVAAVAGIGLILLLFLGSNAERTNDAAFRSGDPRALVDKALSSMTQLDSFHAAFVLSIPPDDVREKAGWEIEFEAPDSYRMLLFGAEGESERRCESYLLPDASGSGETCYDVLISISEYTVAETVVVGDTMYGRRCNETDGVCDPWREQPRGPFVIAGPSPSFLPQWPLVAIELAEDFELVGREDRDGVTLVHFQGSVNHLRAILENQRRVLTAAGITSFGEECTARAIPRIVDETGEPVESTPDRGAEDEESCRELTFEESLEQQEPGLSFYDENPGAIDIWLSPDDFLVHRIVLGIPPDEPGAQESSFTVEYSQFNQIEIEAPQ